MRQTTGIQDGKFRSYWHFDSRADFLANRSRLPEHQILEYEPLFPPPTPTPHPVLLVRVTCQTGLLRGETRLHHICPDGRGEGEGVTQWIDGRRYKLAKTKVPIPGDGWQERCMRDVLGMVKGVLEGVYDGEMIALGDWCGFTIDGETVRTYLNLLVLFSSPPPQKKKKKKKKNGRIEMEVSDWESETSHYIHKTGPAKYYAPRPHRARPRQQVRVRNGHLERSHHRRTNHQ